LNKPNINQPNQPTIAQVSNVMSLQQPEEKKIAEPLSPLRSINVQELKEMNITSLISYAQEIGIADVAALKKQEIILKFLNHNQINVLKFGVRAF
jgi:hypothetical protein